MNKVILCGNLGKDPEVREIGENKLATFSLATNEKWKTGERTDWHNVKAWGRLAEIVGQYLKQGSQVVIEGQIRYDKVEKDGETKFYTSINCTSMEMIGSKQSEEKPKTSPPPIGDESELPF